MGIGVNPANLWRYVYSTVAGTSHFARSLPCQDHSLIREFTAADTEPVLLLVASDGAGSASRADVGSKLVCDSVHARIDAYLKQNASLSDITREVTKSWLDDWIRRDLHKQASVEDLQVREFACTLVAALIGTKTSIFFQIGDGAIVVAEGDEYRHIFWPQNGEYANSTYFVTDDSALDNLLFHKLEPSPVDEISLFTDGLQNLALKFDTKSAHNPFFRPLFARLRCEPPGESEVLTPLLQDFLTSPVVNERTDDDKTLLLATRRAADIVLTQAEEDGRSPTAV
jgi:Protein phosphatase 2C